MRRLALPAAVAIMAAATGAAVAIATHGATSGGAAPRTTTLHGDAVWPAGRRPAPELGLRDQAGQAVSLRSLQGRPVLLTFLDSLCTQLCPVEGRQLADVQRALGPAAPQLVVVSVNPGGDTPASERRFAAEQHWRAPWRWLSGTPARLRAVWHAYGIQVIPKTHDIAHTAVLYLIDARGDERAGYLVPLSPQRIVRDVRTLEGEHA
jgi:cytochrome oxidase Cu insertion factor (SCO1/SenC/PrrC family)